MEFRHLVYFACIVDEGSFAGAAKKLHITQPALSKSIKCLEDELNGRLIDRTSQVRELTHLGKFLYPRAKKLISLYEEIGIEYQQFTEVAKGIIRVGVPPMIGSFVISDLIQRFSERNPNIQIIRDEVGDKVVRRKILHGLLDLGFSPLPLDGDIFEYSAFFSNGLRVVMNKKNKLAKSKTLSLEKLKGESFVLLDENFMLHDNIVAACANAGYKPKIASKSASWDCILELVSNNEYITILPGLIFNRYNREEILDVPISTGGMDWVVALAELKGCKLNPAAKEFKTFTFQYFREKEIGYGK